MVNKTNQLVNKTTQFSDRLNDHDHLNAHLNAHGHLDAHGC